MNRFLLFFFAFGLFLLGAFRMPHKPPVGKPNIIFILADDLGYGDLGCYGQQLIRTPNLDRLAADGIRFTQHYSTAVCAPSRAALMTGQHMGHCPIRGNRQWEPAGQMPLPAESVTVAELLKTAGYTNGLIGKWGLGNAATTGDPLRQGFDTYYGYLDQVLAHNSFPEYLLRDGSRETLPNQVKYLPEVAWAKGLGSYSTEKKAFSNDLFTAESLKFIEENRNRPFFLYLAYTIPHDNGEAPEGQRIEVPDLGAYANRTDWTPDQRRYAAAVTRLDSAVGLLRQRLESLKIAENTLVIFASDNGPDGTDTYGMSRFRSGGNLRGRKRDLYEGGTRVPMIACWPGRIRPGRVSGHPSALWDFLPTACELAGVKPPAATNGISYLPELLGKKQPAHSYLYWELHDGGKKQAVRWGNWKGVKVYSRPNPPLELYDLKTDPSEQNNVAAQHPDVVQRMEEYMKKARTEDANWPL